MTTHSTPTLVVVFNKEREEQALRDSKERIKDLSLDQLVDMLKRVRYVNEGVAEAQPWIDQLENEIALRERNKP